MSNWKGKERDNFIINDWRYVIIICKFKKRGFYKFIGKWR